MSVKEAYYIGVGVFHFDGKDYGYGKKLPATVPADTIDAMKKKGKVSETAPAKEGVVMDNALGVLQDKVQQLILERDEATDAATRNAEEIERLQDRLAVVQGDLSTVTGERDAARSTVTERDTTIEDLTKQLMTPVTPAAPGALAEQGAGPKGGKK